jgi:hypothetical protein
MEIVREPVELILFFLIRIQRRYLSTLFIHYTIK